MSDLLVLTCVYSVIHNTKFTELTVLQQRFKNGAKEWFDKKCTNVNNELIDNVYIRVIAVLSS